MNKLHKLVGAVILLATLSVLMLSQLIGCFGDSTTSRIDAVQQEIVPISESSPEAEAAISGGFEWMRGYFYFQENFAPIATSEPDIMPDRRIFTFTSRGTFRLDVNYNLSQQFATLASGTFDVEEISFYDITAENKLYMKYVNERADTKWYRLIQHNIIVHGLADDAFLVPSEEEVFISWANNDDIIFYWMPSESNPRAETSFFRRVAPAIEGDSTLIESVAGAYMDNEGYDSSSATFAPLPNYQRKTFTFDIDSSFKIEHVGGSSYSYAGSFNVEEIAVDDLDAEIRLLMPHIDERKDANLFHIEAFNVMGTSQKSELELFVSIMDDDDVIIYMITLGETVSARRFWE